MTKNNRIITTIAMLAVGTILAPSVWAASDQLETKASQRHARQAQTPKPWSTRVPQSSCDYDRAAGRCVIDLGNGRCIECSNGPR
jgi:hypothetical protein